MPLTCVLLRSLGSPILLEMILDLHPATQVSLGDRYFLGEVEVAALCGVSRHTVRRWKAAGLLQCVELPFGMRRNLYRKSDVDGFLANLGAGHGR